MRLRAPNAGAVANECGVWPERLRRRGAVAVALLLVSFAGSPLNWRITSLLPIELISAGWQPLISLAVHALAGLALVPLLGPGGLHGAVGRRPSALAMACGLLCAGAGTLMFWSYRSVAAAGSAPGDTSFFLVWVAMVLVGPFTEEWLYRGVLWHASRQLVGPVAAAMITAATFTIGHGPERVRDFPNLFAYGLLLALLRHRSGSLAPALLAHSVTNIALVCSPWWVGSR